MVTSSTRGLIPAIRAAEAWRPPAGGVFPSTLIVRGAQDVRVSEQAARGFADLLGGRFVEIPDAGHLAYIDRPERFAAVVADFHHGLG
jgi:pimeloyl-ACP methyl ester carboxylesterase